MADKYDMRIIPDVSGEVVFDVYGRSADTGLMLLQRLYALLFAEYGAGYRKGRANTGILSLLDGANTPSDSAMNAILSVCKAQALAALDKADRSLIASFVCNSVYGLVECTLTLTDGTTVHGHLNRTNA